MKRFDITKIICVLCLAALLTMMVTSCQSATAKELGENDLEFSQNTDGTYTVKGLKNKPENAAYTVTVPATYNGQPVTRIYGYAFAGCDGLTAVNLPDSIRKIDVEAFAGCKKLKSIQLPASLEVIERYAFMNCTALTAVSLPASLNTVMETAFAHCNNMTDVTVASGNEKFSWRGNCLIQNEGGVVLAAGKGAVIPDDGSVRRIGENAFVNHDELKELTIPESVAEIGFQAFTGCKNLKKIAFPSRLETIEAGAFAECEKLTDIQIPDSVTYICSNAFSDTAWKEDKSAWDGDCLYSGHHLISVRQDAVQVQIRDDTLSIANGAFSGCNLLTTVTVPESVRYIHGGAFDECEKLTELTLPAGLQKLTYHTIWRCPALTTIRFSGTSEQWSELDKEENWFETDSKYDIICEGGN